MNIVWYMANLQYHLLQANRLVKLNNLVTLAALQIPRLHCRRQQSNSAKHRCTHKTHTPHSQLPHQLLVLQAVELRVVAVLR